MLENSSPQSLTLKPEKNCLNGLNKQILSLLIIGVLIGFIGALLIPVLSVHLSENLLIRPFHIGLLFTCNGITGAIASHLIARKSDKGLSRTLIFKLSMLGTSVSAIGIVYIEQYRYFLILMMFWSTSLGVGIPQLFALARENVTGKEAIVFQPMLRATISLGWLTGPPLGFWLFG